MKFLWRIWKNVEWNRRRKAQENDANIFTTRCFQGNRRNAHRSRWSQWSRHPLTLDMSSSAVEEVRGVYELPLQNLWMQWETLPADAKQIGNPRGNFRFFLIDGIPHDIGSTKLGRKKSAAK